MFSLPSVSLSPDISCPLIFDLITGRINLKIHSNCIVNIFFVKINHIRIADNVLHLQKNSCKMSIFGDSHVFAHFWSLPRSAYSKNLFFNLMPTHVTVDWTFSANNWCKKLSINFKVILLNLQKIFTLEAKFINSL